MAGAVMRRRALLAGTAAFGLAGRSWGQASGQAWPRTA